MNFNPLDSYYCSPVLILYSTFVYRVSRLKESSLFDFFNPCIVMDVIQFNVWFLPIFPLTLFSPLVSVYQPLGPGV